jgi:hypothetical protein
MHEHVERLGAGPYAFYVRADRDHGDWLDLERTGGVLIRLHTAS